LKTNVAENSSTQIPAGEKYCAKEKRAGHEALL